MTAHPDLVQRTKKASLSSREWKYAAKRTLSEFTRSGGTDLAAQLTYFVVLAIAPTLLAIFSLTALILSDYQDQIADMIKDGIAKSGAIGSGEGLNSAVSSTLDSLMGSTSGGVLALVIGILTAMWSASAFVKAFSRVSNRIYSIEETRGAIKFNGSMFAVTAGLIGGLLVILVSLILNETVVSGILGPIFTVMGLDGALTFLMSTFLPIWAWVKWPVVLVLLFAVVSLLYWATPNLKRPYRFISAGGVLAVVGIALAVVLLGIYMATIGGYSSYGAIGSVMAALFALWVINIMMILGATFDAEVVRARQLTIGAPAESSFDLPPRGESEPTKAEKKHEDLVDEGRDIRVENLHHAPRSEGSAFPGPADSHISSDAEPAPSSEDTAK